MPPDTCPPHVEIMLGYVGTTEVGDNRGPAVKRFLASVGLPEGYAYCAAFGRYCWDSAGVVWPTVRSGMAQAYRRGGWSVEQVFSGARPLHCGDAGIMQRGRTSFGHFYTVVAVLGRWRIKTVEANVTSGMDETGEWDARRGGVWMKIRNLKKERYAYLRTRWFVRPRYR